MGSLIKATTELYLQISAGLLQFRIGGRRSKGMSAVNIDIAGPLIARVREDAAVSSGAVPHQGEPGASAVTAFEPDSAGREGRASSRGAGLAEAKPPVQPSELARKFAQEPRAGVLLPPVGEQLQRRTLEYINHALELGKQGKVESAETYAKLAQSAMKTAADYLPEDVYLALRARVMLRLQRADTGPAGVRPAV